MRGINTYTLSFLVCAGIANACVYPRYVNEPGEDLAQRRCQVGCDSGDMMEGTANYQACCIPPPKGSPVPATCSVIAASKAIATCPHTSLATTDSTGMAAPTDYTPAYASPAITSAANTADTAGQSYNSGASVITTWVTETASPDCAPSIVPSAATSTPPAEVTYPTSAEPTSPPAESTYLPSSSAAAPSDTSSAASPANTCACPADGASSAPAPAETSDTHGESYSSQTPANNVGDKPGPGDDLTGLDRRLVERTDIQYTCPCPVPVAQTSDTGGESYSSASSSSSSSAAAAETTEDCEEYVPANNVGSMADGEVTDNEAPAKRFLPLGYSISHPIEKRLYDPPPASFVPDGELRKRDGPTGAVTDNLSGVPTTVTSTTTITPACSGTDADQTGAYGPSEVSITGGETSTSGGYPVVAAAPTTNAYGSLTTMWMGGADNPNSTPTAAATDGSNGLSGAVSGVVDGSSFAITGSLAIPTAYSSAANVGSQPGASDGPIIENAYRRSSPEGEVVVENAKRGRRRRWL